MRATTYSLFDRSSKGTITEGMKLELIENPDAETIHFFDERIREFNEARWEVKKKFPIALKIENEQGVIVGGVAAKTFGLWLLIDNLWVHEDFRGQNLGTKILMQLESAAIQRGCTYSLLDTLNFQAQPFYEKFGYKIKWVQENYPETGCKYFMIKNLQPISDF